jgi:hypothetical protein
MVSLFFSVDSFHFSSLTFFLLLYQTALVQSNSMPFFKLLQSLTVGVCSLPDSSIVSRSWSLCLAAAANKLSPISPKVTSDAVEFVRNAAANSSKPGGAVEALVWLCRALCMCNSTLSATMLNQLCELLRNASIGRFVASSFLLLLEDDTFMSKQSDFIVKVCFKR